MAITWQRGETIHIFVSPKEDTAVKIAIDHFCKDLAETLGCTGNIVSLDEWEKENRENSIIIASLNVDDTDTRKSDGLAQPLSCIDVRKMSDENGNLRWEAYCQKVSGNRLFIAGSDRRGTIYGIYKLSEMLGVSPWYYFADVPPKKRERFELAADYEKIDWPDVPYRGIFLNDEEELETWAKRHTKDGTIGPETYGHICELLLRLGGNYLWPAMHVNYFNENPENGRLADEMGIVIGTSHCDMLLRSNQNEWTPWLEKKGYSDIRYDYSVSDHNREILREYWTESVQVNGAYEACYTVGMRGVHDYGFSTLGIDHDTTLSESDKHKKRVELLGTVIRDQRQILKDVLGEERGSGALQIFIPYKEVLPLYDDGLELPEDITLMWVDDNFGYVRRYPNEMESKREGGHGLYYHVSYWGHPGMSYLFINSIPLKQIASELRKCYESNIRKIWVLNVGALKPLEQETEFFIRYGWSAGREDRVTRDTVGFTTDWINKNFSGQHGKEVAALCERFAQITNVCKLEHMQSDKFTQDAYGNEALARVVELQGIYEQGAAIMNDLPEEEQDAFFQLVLMKFAASYLVNASFYFADRSKGFYERGAMQSADLYLELSRKMDRYKRNMLAYYNKTMQNGKWDGILTPESFSPPPMVLYPLAKPALVIQEPKLATDAEQVIRFSYFGSQEKKIILWNEGAGTVSYQIKKPKWLEVSNTEGVISADRTIRVGIAKEYREEIYAAGVEGTIEIWDHRECISTVNVLAEAKEEILLPEEAECVHMEADGYVVIPVEEAGEKSKRDGWMLLEGLGRGFGDAIESRMCLKHPDENYARDYDIYLNHSGTFLLEIQRYLTLNSTGNIRFAICVDGGDCINVQSGTTDEWRGMWRDAVMNDGEKLFVKLPYMDKGFHRLSVIPCDKYVTLTKLIIYTEPRKESSLGPVPESEYAPIKEKMNAVESGDDCGDYFSCNGKIFSTRAGYLPMLYADEHFYETNRLYICSDEIGQEELGEKRYRPDQYGKKNVIAEFGSGVFMEKDGVLAIETEYVLEETEHAYTTKGMPCNSVWSHTQAQTDGETGLAMYLEGNGRAIIPKENAPGMHYKVHIENAGEYRIWLLVKFDDHLSDSCYLALDGDIQDAERQFSGGNLFTYCMKQRWNWQCISKMEFAKGEHIFSIYGRKNGLRIDRIYMSKGEEWPPVDKYWKLSDRKTDGQ